jgi:hypothetical protein
MEAICCKIISDFQHLEKVNEEISDENKELRRQNLLLIENERDLMSVSTIVSTKNENAKLRDEIVLLKKSLYNLKVKYTPEVSKPIYSYENQNHELQNKPDAEPDAEPEAEPEAEPDTIYMIKYKGSKYFLDKDNMLFVICDNNTKGGIVGERYFDEKKKKYKYKMY